MNQQFLNGDWMKKTGLCRLSIALAAILVTSISGFGRRTMSQTKELKTLQKAARKRMKLEQRSWKRSFHGRRIPPAQRLLVKRQYQQYMRNLRAQQKAERQQLKDQLSMAKAARKIRQ
jgi:hypothetical protein